MGTELDRIELGRFAQLGGFLGRPDHWARRRYKRHFLWLPLVLFAALASAAAWINHDSRRAANDPLTVAIEASSPSPETAPAPVPRDDKTVTRADAPLQTLEQSPVNALSITSQYWQRGGLGSKALVTLTLRNNNDYAVKDIELLCAFVRRDGSHLTDRRRVISDTVNMRTRKTFAQMLIGFVNVNAARAKCTTVAANRT